MLFPGSVLPSCRRGVVVHTRSPAVKRIWGSHDLRRKAIDRAFGPRTRRVRIRSSFGIGHGGRKRRDPTGGAHRIHYHGGVVSPRSLREPTLGRPSSHVGESGPDATDRE